MNRRQLFLASTLALLGCKDKNPGTQEDATTKNKNAGAKPAGAKPPGLSNEQSVTEGHALTMFLLCMHPDNYNALKATDKSESRPAAFTNIRDDVYLNLHDALTKPGTLPGIDPEQRIQVFQEAFVAVSRKALNLSGDPYNGDPNGCLSAKTIDNLKNVGLIKAT